MITKLYTLENVAVIPAETEWKYYYSSLLIRSRVKSEVVHII